MLFETLSKLKQRSIMTSIVILAVAILLLICPDRYISSVINLAGYALLILAVVLILEFASGKRSLSDFILLGIALALAILGTVILVAHDNILPVLSWLFGLALILDGVNSLHYTLTYARRAGRSGWQVLIVLSVLLFALGLIIVINPWWNTPKALLSVIAAAMIFSAAAGIFRIIWTWPVRTD